MRLATALLELEAPRPGEELCALDSDSTLVLAFGPSSCLSRSLPLDRLRQDFPRSHLIGCSTSGEIFGDSIHDETLSVAVARFDATELRHAAAPVHSAEDSRAAGREIAQALFRPDLRAVIVFSDGLHVNGSELVRGLNQVLPPSVVVTGGLAGDGPRFETTWVLRDGCPANGFVTAVGLYGRRLQVGHGSKGGWDLFGPERLVTRSEGNVLYELDGRPALTLYKEYLGDRASELPASALLFPLCIREQDTDAKSIVRTILGIDEATQSLRFAGDIPQGTLAQLMRANFDRLIQGAAEAAHLASEPPSSSGSRLGIAVSCVGRRLILGERAEEELEATMEGLPSGTQLVGFYSYGEISPWSTGHCDLHNQTMTLTTLSEA